MTIAPVVMSALGQLIREACPLKSEMQGNLKNPLIASGALKSVEPDGDEFVVNLDGVGAPSGGFISDGSAIYAGSARQPVKARALPCILQYTGSIGRSAAGAHGSSKSPAKLVIKELDLQMSNLHRDLNRAIHGGTVSPTSAVPAWTGTTANSTVTLNFNDVSLFRVNESFDFVDTSGNTSNRVRVTAIAPAAGTGGATAAVAGDVSFINDCITSTGTVASLGATAIAINDIFALAGTYTTPLTNTGTAVATGNVPNSLSLFADVSASVMGQTPGTAPGWAGVSRAAGVAYNQQIALSQMGLIQQQSGEVPDVCVMHPQLASAHAAQASNQGTTFGLSAGAAAGRKLDVGSGYDQYKGVLGGQLSIAGTRIIQDFNCPATTQVFFNSEFTKLCYWRKPAAFNLGGGMEGGEVAASRGFYNYEFQLSTEVNLVSNKRSTVGALTGFTTL